LQSILGQRYIYTKVSYDIGISMVNYFMTQKVFYETDIIW